MLDELDNNVACLSGELELIIDVMRQKKVAAQNTGELASAPVNLGIDATETTSGRESRFQFGASCTANSRKISKSRLLTNSYSLSLLPLLIKIT
jgi:hypothetical protein